MSDTSRTYKVKIDGDANDFIKKFAKVSDIADKLKALNNNTIAITFDPKNLEEGKTIIEGIKKLVSDPLALRLDTSKIEKDIENTQKKLAVLQTKASFTKNGIYASTGKGKSANGYDYNSETREQMFKELVKDMNDIPDSKLTKLAKNSGLNKDTLNTKKEEIQLEAKLLELYQEHSKLVSQLTSTDDWKNDEKQIESICEHLQIMNDIQKRFEGKKTGFLKLDTNELESSIKVVKELEKTTNTDLSNLNRDLSGINSYNNQIELFVNNISQAIKGVKSEEFIPESNGLNEAIANTEKLGEETKETTDRIKELNAEMKSGNYGSFGKAVLPSSAAGINNRTNNIGNYINNIQERYDLISSQDVKDASEVKAALFQINTLEQQIQQYEEKVAASGKLSADEAKRFELTIEAASGRLKELKQGFSDIDKELTNINAKANSPANLYSNGNKIPNFKGKFTAKVGEPSSAGNVPSGNSSIENGLGSGGSSGGGNGGLSNGTSPVIPPTVETKLILNTSEAETKFNEFKGKVQSPIEAPVNMTGTIKSDMDIVTTDLKFLTEMSHNVNVGMVAQNEELLDQIATKLRNLKDNSNIDVKVATEDLGKTNAKVGVKLPTQKEVLGQINTTLLSVEPKLHKLALQFKNPIKKDILTPVNEIIKEIKEKVGTIPVKVTYGKNNNSKISSLTTKFEDIAVGAELIGEAFKNSSSVVNASIDKNLPKLYEMWQVTDEIVRCLKTVKGMDLKIKNVTYNSKDGVASTNASKAAKEQKEEAEETVALLKQIETAKKQLEKSGNSASKEYQTLEAKITSVNNNYKNLPLDKQKELTKEIKNQCSALEVADKALKERSNLLDQMQHYQNINSAFKDVKDLDNGKFKTELESIINDLKTSNDSTKELNERFKELKKNVSSLSRRNSKNSNFDAVSVDDLKNKLTQQYGTLESFSANITSNPNITKITASYRDLNGTLKTLAGTYDQTTQKALLLNQADKESIKWSEKLTNTLKVKSRELLAYLGTFASFYAVMNTIKQGLSIVKQMDDAMTELHKVSSDSATTIDAFKSKSFELGNEIGATGATITEAAAEWARLGYSMKEVSELSQASSIYVNVGDGIDATTATEDLVSTMKAFHLEAEDTIGIVDRLNEVSNNYAISSDGIGAALKRSSSALETANNDLDQSIAMITAMNEIVQDPENVGNTLKILSLRIRGASAALKDKIMSPYMVTYR